jgi:hypothetical protein
VDTENLVEVKAMLATRVEQWEQAIRLEGREKGREEGETTLLIKMLELKYAPLPSWVQQKIAQADANAIEQWAAKLLNVQTLEEVFNSET